MCILLAASALLALAASAHAQFERRFWNFDREKVNGFEEGPQRDDIVPGEFLIDPPTLNNLGFRWYIAGDSNRNAAVTVAYRKAGGGAWREALPMLRVHHEIVTRYFYNGDMKHYRTGNLFAGSVFSLEPGTKYDVRFTMTDPDGGAPEKAKVITVATRAEPRAAKDGRTLHVPADAHEPARRNGRDVDTPTFNNLDSAYHTARPGDVILLHAGVHKLNDAPYVWKKSGEPGEPIVIRGQGAGSTILEGPDRKTDLFRIPGADHLIFEDLTVRRGAMFLRTGEKSAHDKGGPGASHLTVRRCVIEDVINGMWTASENSKNWTLVDNVITGIDPEWYPRTLEGGDYMRGSHTGVNVYGQGHVVAHNRVSRFSDSLAIFNYGQPPDDVRKQAVNIDFAHNDLSFAIDDTVEADYGCHNIRVIRNLVYNTHTGLSAQPVYGGPIYFIRNEGFGLTHLNFKWNNFGAGIVAYHNTLAGGGTAFTSPYWSNSHLRNNLLLGNGGLISSGTFTPDRTTMDYNGYRGAAESRTPIRWSHGERERKGYASLEDFTAATGYEKHGRRVEYDIFVDGSPVERGKTYEPDAFDFRLKPGGNAVDAGVRLPNVNDDHTGAAPDLGALEYDEERPRYGPQLKIGE
ncbi:MAG: hypothetical protein ACQESR_00485 [Planctomycetota bacterium]